MVPMRIASHACMHATGVPAACSMQTGIGLAPEASQERIRTNDRPNAELVAATKKHATLLVPSTIPFRAAAAAS